MPETVQNDTADSPLPVCKLHIEGGIRREHVRILNKNSEYQENDGAKLTHCKIV
jgi:hypothetical protein